MRSKSHFHFKKFSISHERSTMKVGTDAVLLGAWASVGDAKRILDIGTGNGTIALMLAQRSVDLSEIDAVEIEATDALQAAENFNQSRWKHKLHMHHSSIQSFYPDKKYNLIVSNPPYFSNSQSPPDQRRYHARHTIKLNHNDLTTAVIRLLEDDGKFNVVLPYEEGVRFMELAETKMLYCSRRFSFRTRAEKKVERLLIEFQRQPQAAATGEILLYKNKTGEIWDDTYKNLTRDFYIKL
jgi:tRNA1Val (adenine37-N6)-methyltransferase